MTDDPTLLTLKPIVMISSCANLSPHLYHLIRWANDSRCWTTNVNHIKWSRAAFCNRNGFISHIISFEFCFVGFWLGRIKVHTLRRSFMSLHSIKIQLDIISTICWEQQPNWCQTETENMEGTSSCTNMLAHYCTISVPRISSEML